MLKSYSRSCLVAGLLLLLGAGCGSDGASNGDAGAGADVDAGAEIDAAVDSGVVGVDLSKPTKVDLTQTLPTQLSGFNFFKWDPATATFTYHDGILPYEPNTALFSDYAVKNRAIYVPAGSGGGTFDPELAFDFPVGTVVIKNFAIPADMRAPTQNVRLIETRLLVRFDSGWQGFPYIWNADQTDATYTPAGEVRQISFIDSDGSSATANYLIPQKNQCSSCHARRPTPDPLSAPVMTLLGIKARHLDRVYDYGGTIGPQNQLTRMADEGFLTNLPDLSTITPAYDFRSIEAGGVAAIPAGDVEKAARDYLDINCAHCHNPNGVQGETSQLFLNHDNTSLFNLGVCKQPGSAGSGTGGHKYDIVPQNSDLSILKFRIHTTDPGAMMPLLGRSLEHRRGVELITAWIDAMPAATPPCADPY
ncbi:MAG: SO2930 family diheme c-type cytochrome [Myxococcales bacterium]